MKTLAAAAFLLLTVPVFAQEIKEYDNACQCFVLTNHYDNGSVSTVYHENQLGQKHGIETVYYADGVKQYERNWTNGQLDGSGVHYSPEGKIYYKTFYANGRKIGTWTYYDAEGDVMQTITYNPTATNDSDGTYDYYLGGVKYFTQIVQNGNVAQEIVVNQVIYDNLMEEAAAAAAAGKSN